MAHLSRDDIANRAYQIYLREGQPQGRQEIHWRLAEQELLSEQEHTGEWHETSGETVHEDRETGRMETRHMPPPDDNTGPATTIIGETGPV